ncbi:MAG: hypothetical protein JF618_13355 [Leifsonia sp.]|nr:hypothetical protein [Leifsonia sp.]
MNAPGLSGITIPAGSQRIFSLAGFAPGLASPVVHIEARGGQVVAFLQQSIVRGLDSVGVDLVDAGAEPAKQLTIPGVRIRNAIGVNSALTLVDWQDVGPAVRIAVPGTKKTKVTVNVIPVDPKVDGTSFQTTVDPGKVDELALDSGAEVDTGVALADGTYTVTIESDQPVVAGVRVSTAVGDGGDQGDAAPQAPPSDLAWYASSPALTGDTLVSIAPGPDPQLELTNPTKAEVTVVAKAQGGGDDITIKVPGNGAASVAVKEGLTYLLTAATGLHAAVSYAGDAQLAAYPVTSSRPVSGPIVIRP